MRLDHLLSKEKEEVSKAKERHKSFLRTKVRFIVYFSMYFYSTLKTELGSYKNEIKNKDSNIWAHSSDG